ncbi:synaptosomal-associated protein 29-like protein [Leptotrombidium deliense]|uniref:Synaptosomal-associated protein 29-like protein n=1 Tax=Leptotrombidium deliense TaxID=299467 RepID=A0A443S8L5_9ACAR|nr:synaptosomal-associated protein 29-like protein [Leptotrombidium deliense]
MNGKSVGFGDWNDDVDDFAFLSHPRQGTSGYLLSNGHANGVQNSVDDRRQQLLQERRRIEERTLESSKVSLGLVYDSEKVALSTAEELTKQREQLNGVEEKLDYVNSAMRVSQKHLNSMKSIFGGIKSYFSKTPETPTYGSRPTNSKSMDQSSEKLEKGAAIISANNDRSKNMKVDISGFNFEDDENEAFEDRQKNRKELNYNDRSRQIDQQLDSNLTEIDSGLYRLKSLAIGLNSEIDEQNRMLDRITSKSERAEDTVNYQTRQMKNLLR